MAQKISVLFEAGPMVDKHKTGVGYYVTQLIASLSTRESHNLDLTGYYFNFLGQNHNDIPAKSYVRYHKIWLIPGKILSLCRRFGFQPFLELFTWQKSDILMFTNYVALPTLRKRKVALVIYDLSFLDHPEYMQDINLNYLQRFCPPSIRRADYIVTISDFTRQRLLAHFPDLTATIVVTPIPPTPLANPQTVLNERLRQLGIQPKRYILYLGTIEPRKNIQNLVQAYGLLDPTIRSRYSLVLAGGKGWKDEAILNDISLKQNLGDSIIMTGYTTEDEKQALYAQASCFVLPSHYEGFGMPILEAMQFKLPVAVSDIPVFHEVAGKAAAYFDKDNPIDISATLTTLLTDARIRGELIEASRHQLDQFSWKQNADQVYRQLSEKDASAF